MGMYADTPADALDVGKAKYETAKAIGAPINVPDVPETVQNVLDTISGSGSNGEDVTARFNELKSIEGLHERNPESGAKEGIAVTHLTEYTNRIFGAPFQFMNSVDGRFKQINSHLGNQYLEHFILNAPVLTIKPGFPRFKARSQGFLDKLKEFIRTAKEGSVLEATMQMFLYDSQRLQMRMFDFHQQYIQYLYYIEYLLRSIARYLELVESPPSKETSGNSKSEDSNKAYEAKDDGAGNTIVAPKSVSQESNEQEQPTETSSNSSSTVSYKNDLPSGTFINEYEYQDFNEIDWGQYKMLTTKYERTFGKSPLNQIAQFFGIDLNTGTPPPAEDLKAQSNLSDEAFNRDETGRNFGVRFIAAPIDVEDMYTNETQESFIKQKIGDIGDKIGNEIAFITNSNADVGVLGSMVEFAGGVSETVLGTVNDAAAGPLLGGLFTNVFGAAMGSVKGQKMIYPKIYRYSSTENKKTFQIHLYSPYGDNYNYFMNIIVPLMHLIALAAPRMVNANNFAAPFIVQAFIPGVYNCQMGIITNLTVKKSTDKNHISVNGFPLDVEVEITIEELYSNLSISPSYDPGSFLFNESLNDYMANLAGLPPSNDTTAKKKEVMAHELEKYFSGMLGRTKDSIGDEVMEMLTRREQ